MTEADWLAATDPELMIQFLRGKASDRKLRLFAVGCCRGIWHHLPAPSQTALTVIERFADGVADQSELSDAQDTSGDSAQSSDGESVWLAADSNAWFAATESPRAAAGREVILGWPGRNDYADTQFAQELLEKANLCRDIFGNPFRPVVFDPAWRTETAVALATGIYAERAFDRMPILADALQDAGCENSDILTHCRGDGPHARGCWVVDLVLGKE